MKSNRLIALIALVVGFVVGFLAGGGLSRRYHFASTGAKGPSRGYVIDNWTGRIRLLSGSSSSEVTPKWELPALQP